MPRVDNLNKRIKVLVYGQRTKVYTTTKFPTRDALISLPPDEQIELVCERYKLWMLNFADELAQKPNTGYAVLSLLNSYFEMIAQLSGSTGDHRLLVQEGLKKVFPELVNEQVILDELVNRLRNPMAHMGATQDHIILIDLYDKPLVWGAYRRKEAIVINPRLWVGRICEHFDEFFAQLRDPNQKYDPLRQSFLNRLKRPT